MQQRWPLPFQTAPKLLASTLTLPTQHARCQEGLNIGHLWFCMGLSSSTLSNLVLSINFSINIKDGRSLNDGWLGIPYLITCLGQRRRSKYSKMHDENGDVLVCYRPIDCCSLCDQIAELKLGSDWVALDSSVDSQ